MRKRSFYNDSLSLYDLKWNIPIRKNQHNWIDRHIEKFTSPRIKNNDLLEWRRLIDAEAIMVMMF